MQNSRISNRRVRKMKNKYTILASNGPRMLGNMFHQSRQNKYLLISIIMMASMNKIAVQIF
jgi:hypothetical protein